MFEAEENREKLLDYERMRYENTQLRQEIRSLERKLKAINFTDSSLQFKKIEKPNIEEFKQEFFICIENEYVYKKSGEYWTEQQITDRYKNMYG